MQELLSVDYSRKSRRSYTFVPLEYASKTCTTQHYPYNMPRSASSTRKGVYRTITVKNNGEQLPRSLNRKLLKRHFKILFKASGKGSELLAFFWPTTFQCLQPQGQPWLCDVLPEYGDLNTREISVLKTPC